ncbi:MAG: hypothetical protein ABJB86_09135 [Bacteroidota bacterium]
MVRQLTFVIELLVAFLVTGILQYWAHLVFHNHPSFWRFHSVHHPTWIGMQDYVYLLQVCLLYVLWLLLRGMYSLFRNYFYQKQFPLLIICPAIRSLPAQA